MTIAIALKDTHNKRIIVGTDTQATYGQLTYKTEDKIIELQIQIVDGYDETITTEVLHIAMAGNLYLSSFLKYGFQPPTMSEHKNFTEYLYQDFLPELKILLHEDNLVVIDNNVTDTESKFIFIFKDQIYSIQYNFGVNQLNNSFLVEGSGWQVATGSLYTNLNYHKNMDYEEMVKQAIEACGNNTIYCNSTPNIKIIKY